MPPEKSSNKLWRPPHSPTLLSGPVSTIEMEEADEEKPVA
jgi:hypothetical protein